MQGEVPSLYFVENCTTLVDDDASVVEEDVSMLTDFHDVADLASGYAECMEEAMRYLTEVEKYPVHHPAVEALKSHLDQYRKQLLQLALYRTSGINRPIL